MSQCQSAFDGTDLRERSRASPRSVLSQDAKWWPPCLSQWEDVDHKRRS